MKTAVIYARYSSDSQTEQSIGGQLRVCEEYAKTHDILILDTYIDRAMTGTNDNRPDFQRMIKDSYRKEWNYVLVYKLDRFSRDKYETALHKKTLKNNGVKLVSAMENIPDTPEGIILESLLEGMNQYYSAELSQKVKRGMKETRRKGNYQGGALLYGYKIEGRKIVINETEAEVVRYMYKEYSKGVYVKDIIASLTAKGILYKGKPFVRNSVYNILRNEKYSGKYMHGDELVDNMYPQIVPQELFETVRKIVNKNKFGKHSKREDILLRGKIICGYCGQNINAESGTTKTGDKIYYYKCNGRKKRINDCQKSMIRKEVLEQLVIDTIITEINNANTIDFIVKNILLLQEQQIKANSSLIFLQRELKQVETSLNNIVAAIERGVISNTTTKRLHELEEQQENLQRQILIEKSKTTIKLSEKEVRAYFEQALKLEPQMLINYFVKQIILYDDKIEIIFNSPLKNNIGGKSSDECQGFSFYKGTVYISTYLYYRTEPIKHKMVMELFICI